MGCVRPDNVCRSSGVGSQQYYDLMANPPTHPSGRHAPMPQYYMLWDQRRIERVPRPLIHSPPQETIPPITFSVNGWAGVRAKDVLRESMTVDGAQDLVFEQYGWRSTVLNLEWPGYEIGEHHNPMNARIDVRPGGGYMTREHLVRCVCGLLFEFHRNASKHHIAPGLEKWALTIGPEGIRVPDIVLFSIHYYRTVWIPELYVIE